MKYNNNNGDSDFFGCLLTYFKANRLELKDINKIRNEVYLLSLQDGTKFIIKGFPDQHKWAVQRKLSALLERSRFSNSYKFITTLDPFKYNRILYSFIEYIPPHEKRFDFDTMNNRREGMELLSRFHEHSAVFVPNFNDKLPRFQLLRKWSERFYLFLHNLPIIRRFVAIDILDQWIWWANWSLRGVFANLQYETLERQVIIHGDVAHHNFLRSKDGNLYLIDFDLIAIAPPMFDYLQYANRLLPVIASHEEIWAYPQLAAYRYNQLFLYGLAFPTDIFREWNRVISSGLSKSDEQIYYVWKLTAKHFPFRMALNHAILEMVL
ncbi:phosphotransferase [Peribacillus sp. SCS-155]|uniref:phosphotransferase n=1 Tax=Peribacillus sedimenti TaxID=3115297 RepID=UPI0039058999